MYECVCVSVVCAMKSLPTQSGGHYSTKIQLKHVSHDLVSVICITFSFLWVLFCSLYILKNFRSFIFLDFYVFLRVFSIWFYFFLFFMLLNVIYQLLLIFLIFSFIFWWKLQINIGNGLQVRVRVRRSLLNQRNNILLIINYCQIHREGFSWYFSESFECGCG
jgi:hypothetical protein